jgi:hypothetical protein
MLIGYRLSADNRIVINFCHPPEEISKSIAAQEAQSRELEKIKKNIDTKTPGQNSIKIAKNALFKKLNPPLSGIMGLYSGYWGISNQMGILSFPLRHAAQKIVLAITPVITPIKIKGSTISHLEYVTDNNNPTKIYTCEMKKDEKQVSFWEIKETPVPQDKRVSPSTVVILAKPDNFFVPTGIIMATENVQLILPNIYVISRSSIESAVLRNLDISRFFECIEKNIDKPSGTVERSLDKNI